MLLIKNGIIYTMDGPPLRGGSILIKNHRIEKIFQKNEPVPETEESKVIDAKDCWVLPGFIDAHSHVGITEDSVGEAGDDTNEFCDPITPSLNAIDGINPMDPAFQDAVKAGITSVMTGPGSSNVVGGSFACIKTSGRVVDEMIVKSPAAMKIAFGENPKYNYRKKDKSPVTRMAIAAMLRREILKAEHYRRVRSLSQTEHNRNFEVNLHYESWIPVLEGKIPLKAHVHRADDILTAIRISKEFGLRMTLDHCSEGHLIAKSLKASGHPVIMGPGLQGRVKSETKELCLQAPAILEQQGVKVALMTDHPVSPVYMLPIYAGISVREGLSLLGGLKAITVHAAEACGVADRIGQIREGMDADIAIFDGNPLETFTQTLYTIINGKIVYLRGSNLRFGMVGNG